MPVATITIVTGQISSMAIVEITHLATVLICSSGRRAESMGN
jgi:hypothetical protein